jgi:hypothetical protein
MEITKDQTRIPENGGEKVKGIKTYYNSIPSSVKTTIDK